MSVFRKSAAIFCVAALATCLLTVGSVQAGKKNTVTGEIVSFDLEHNQLVVKDSGSGENVTLVTSEKTSVTGLKVGAAQDGVSVLVGMKGYEVVVKFKDNGNGKEASFIRLKV